MALTVDRDRFFQTTASIEDSERKKRKSSNTFGSPVKFQSKLLALQINHAADQDGDLVFVAEAAGALSVLKLSTNEISQAGTASAAPLTSLAYSTSKAIHVTPFETRNVFAGCWDKKIVKYSFELAPRADIVQTFKNQNAFLAHNDFVKCLCIAPTPDKDQVLISGGADGELNFWTLQGQRLATLRPNCRSIECIVLDPLSTSDAPIVFFSTSQREIFQVQLPSLQDFSTHNLKISNPIITHETSVYKLFFDDDGDLWTASADKTAKHLVRDNGWTADTILAHPDFVRDVVVHRGTRFVVTACRDEEIRVWNGSTTELVHVFTGHYEEVTGLAITGDLLLSISIDATLRRWSLAPNELQKAIDTARNPDLLAENPEPKVDTQMLTAEEEAELQALMEGEDEEALEKMALDQQ